MKTVAYCPLLYGRDYLGAAIRSVIDAVDELHIIYTPIGSHGHRTDIQCPETKAELYEIAHSAARHKLFWHEGIFAYEGQQREMIFQYAPDADVILALDADEIWADGLAEYVTEIYMRFKVNNIAWDCQRVRVPMVHFWRSLYRCVLHDPAYPERIIFPKETGRPTITLDAPYRIAHMGYAQRSEIVGYKLLTHGHKGEFRRDCDWFRDVFMTNRQNDCHPVGSEYWNPEAVNPLDYLPAWMADHPYFGMEVIP